MIQTSNKLVFLPGIRVILGFLSVTAEMILFITILYVITYDVIYTIILYKDEILEIC